MSEQDHKEENNQVDTAGESVNLLHDTSKEASGLRAKVKSAIRRAVRALKQDGVLRKGRKEK